MLDGGLQAARSRGSKVRLWHLADIYAVAEHVRLWGYGLVTMSANDP
jgi:hypothetical protein